MKDSINIMNKVTGYIQYKHISDIMNSLRQLNYAVIKGCPLSYYAYSDFGKRRFLDTDLLIERKDMDSIENIMLEHGFGQRFKGDKPEKEDREKRILCTRYLILIFL